VDGGGLPKRERELGWGGHFLLSQVGAQSGGMTDFSIQKSSGWGGWGQNLGALPKNMFTLLPSVADRPKTGHAEEHGKSYAQSLPRRGSLKNGSRLQDSEEDKGFKLMRGSRTCREPDFRNARKGYVCVGSLERGKR